MGNTMIFPGNATASGLIATKHNFESGDFTLHCWMRADGAGPLFTQPATGLTVAVTPAGALQFTVRYGDELQAIQTEQTGLNDGDWNHVAAVREGDTLTLYLNGRKADTTQQWLPVEAAGSDGSDLMFPGDMGALGIWSRALTPDEVRATFIEPPAAKAPGLLKMTAREKVSALTALSVHLTIKNTTGKALKKKTSGKNSFAAQFPDVLEAEAVTDIEITNQGAVWKSIECDVTYENNLGSIEINLLKTRNQFNSSLTAPAQGNLTDELSISQSTAASITAAITVTESLELAMMKNFYHFLESIYSNLKRDQVVTAGGNIFQAVDYNKACQIFNLYYELKPLAIVYCESTEDVQFVYTKAVENNLPVRVRSGGHDHAGECSGTDTIVLDMSRIDHVNLVRPKGDHGPVYAHIGAGNRFIRLTSILARHNVMIPHGTCATVGISGYTMGGGWGPWTRKEGMCCERLMGATIVLGDGSVETLDATDGEVPELLWALRGGGGMSYGIVTELVIETFPLPKELIKFEAEWNPYVVENGKLTLSNVQPTPTLLVLQSWENTIQAKNTPKLIGTNLKVSAKHWGQDSYKDFDAGTVHHNCIMYGYWEGKMKDLEAFLKKQFANVPRYELRIDGKGGDGVSYGTNLMNKWDRESYVNVKRKLKGLKGRPIPPDLDAPAPHKITSRLAERQGLGTEGYKALLESLTSPLIAEENRALGLFSYITLGAITGDFYRNMPEDLKAKSAFPYKDRLYTIQYQTWWNEQLSLKEEWQNNDVYRHTNRALDWMQRCRDFDIPNTSGAFISFKDSSVPTRTYFDTSYDKLMSIKKAYSKDPYNHFRTRKTIL